jgi:hypothetical protein
MPTASALGKTYCPQCGWNREAAEKQTRLLLRLLPVLVILFDAPLIIWIFVGHAEVPVLAALGALALVPAILVVLVMRGKVRVGALGARSAQSTPQGTILASVPRDAMIEQYAALSEVQRPRPVRMSRQGKMNTAIISITLLLFAGGLVAMIALHPAAQAGEAASGASATLPRSVVYLLPVGLIATIAFAMRRSLAQQRWLLTMGEVAMGRVTKQWTARNGNGIRYDFTTPSGEMISGISTDSARELLVGMSVPIFYDPQNPKKQVASCAAFFEVVLHGEK